MSLTSHRLKIDGFYAPFYKLDDPKIKLKKVDIVGALPPCAGLSQLNTSTNADSGSARGGDAVQNEWMYKSSRFVLEHVKPKVLWGENAPNLFTGAGQKVREDYAR